MRFYFSPLFSNSFLPKEKGERLCNELSEAKVPDFIGIQKKATHGKQANACLLPPGEGVSDANRRRMRDFIKEKRKYNERVRESKRRYYAKYPLIWRKEKRKKQYEINFEVKGQKIVIKLIIIQ